MLIHNAVIPCWSAILVNWVSYQLNQDYSLNLYPELIDKIISIKSSLECYDGDDTKLELITNRWKIKFRVKDILFIDN